MTNRDLQRSGDTLALIQIGVAVVAGIAASQVAPHLDTAARHQSFVDFFATSAQVIAALLIALAVEARVAIRGRFLAIVTALSVAIGEVSAVAALSPALEPWIYDWLFAFTVGGGLGALVAAVVVGAQTLAAELDAARVEDLALWLSARGRTPPPMLP